MNMLKWIKEKYHKWQWCLITGFSSSLYDELKQPECIDMSSEKAEKLRGLISNYCKVAKDEIDIYTTPYVYGVEIDVLGISAESETVVGMLRQLSYSYSTFIKTK